MPIDIHIANFVFSCLSEQNRVTDHRINKTLHELESVLDGAALPEFIQALRVEEQTDLLMAMNEEMTQ